MAEEWFAPGEIASADRLRALVGEAEHDQRAGADAFAVLDLVLERRLRRKLLTVVDAVHPPAPVDVVHPELVTAPVAAIRQQEEPMPLSFGLQIATFEWPPEDIRTRLAGIARAAEEAGFTSCG